MRYVHLQPTLPGASLMAVHAQLTLVTDTRALTTIGHSVVDLVNLDRLALGVSPPLSAQDAPKRIRDVLRELRDAQSMLLDLPPFP